MKVLIAGSRTFDDPEFMKAQMYYAFKDEVITEIVHGGQVSYKKDGTKYGADYWGGEWAKEREVPVRVFKADWDKYGNSAGPVRNAEMANYLNPSADAAIVFWNGSSKGSKDMIIRLDRRKVKTHIIHFNTQTESK